MFGAQQRRITRASICWYLHENRGVRFRQFQDFKQYYLNCVPPTSRRGVRVFGHRLAARLLGIGCRRVAARWPSIYLYIHIYRMYIYIYIYIYTERERETVCIYIYIYSSLVTLLPLVTLPPRSYLRFRKFRSSVWTHLRGVGGPSRS